MTDNFSLALTNYPLYSKVNKKGDLKQNNLEESSTNSSKAIEKIKELTENNHQGKCEPFEVLNESEVNKMPWTDLKRRNFTLEEILSLETNNEVIFI